MNEEKNRDVVSVTGCSGGITRSGLATALLTSLSAMRGANAIQPHAIENIRVGDGRSNCLNTNCNKLSNGRRACCSKECFNEYKESKK